jgi:hypothetical protein
MRRPLPLLLLAAPAALAACSAATVPPAAPRPAAPLPLVVGLCLPPDSPHAALFGADGELFRRVRPTLAAGERPDLVATVRVAGREVRRNHFALGLFWWTLGIVPDVVHLRQTVRVELRPPAGGPNACAVPWSDEGSTTTAGDVVVLDGRGAVTGVSGWAALLLRPTPWWKEDAVFVHELPPGAPIPSEQLGRAERAAVARAVLERSAALRALAGR